MIATVTWTTLEKYMYKPLKYIACHSTPEWNTSSSLKYILVKIYINHADTINVNLSMQFHAQNAEKRVIGNILKETTKNSAHLTENMFLYISNEIVQSFIYNSPLLSQNEYVIYYILCTIYSRLTMVRSGGQLHFHRWSFKFHEPESSLGGVSFNVSSVFSSYRII